MSTVYAWEDKIYTIELCDQNFVISSHRLSTHFGLFPKITPSMFSNKRLAATIWLEILLLTELANRNENMADLYIQKIGPDWIVSFWWIFLWLKVEDHDGWWRISEAPKIKSPPIPFHCRER